MARITVEDCIDSVTNRFELVLVASQRAKEIGGGAPVMVSIDNDKNAVIALREIAQNKVKVEVLRHMLVRGTKYKLDESGEFDLEEEEDEISSDVKNTLKEEGEGDSKPSGEMFGYSDIDVDLGD